MRMPPLTTTSYAVLGWLSFRPWSTYELAQQMRRNLHFFWPRAESHLYDEPKALVAHGLARAQVTMVGHRRRTVYAITGQGRRALARWQRQACAAPRLEMEALVRVLFGATGTPADLCRAVASARALADDIQARGRTVAAEYLGGTAPVPERIHCSGLVFDFLWNHGENLRRWADHAERELARWADTAPDDAKAGRAKRTFRRALRENAPGRARAQAPGAAVRSRRA
jgi:DNA-binding PadR family transcriptional regulator